MTAGAHIMKVRVLVPAAFADQVAADFAARGGRVEMRSSVPTGVALSGLAPVDALADYGAALRQISAGHGTYESHFDHFEAPAT